MEPDAEVNTTGAAVPSCPACGATNKATAKFCRQCGAAMPDRKHEAEEASRRDELVMQEAAGARSAAQTAGDVAKGRSRNPEAGGVKQPGGPRNGLSKSAWYALVAVVLALGLTLGWGVWSLRLEQLRLEQERQAVEAERQSAAAAFEAERQRQARVLEEERQRVANDQALEAAAQEEAKAAPAARVEQERETARVATQRVALSPSAREAPISQSSTKTQSPAAEGPSATATAAPESAPAPAASSVAPSAALPSAASSDSGSASPSPGTMVDQFNEMNDLIAAIERLSKQARKAHENVGREDDEVWLKLDAFVDAAQSTRKAFRKATGTGFTGVFSNISSAVRRNRGDRDADSRVVEISVEDLVRRADAVESAAASAPIEATTQEYWQQTRENLTKLSALVSNS